MGVQVRISKTDFHKESWDDKIESLINETPYWKIEGLGKDIEIFPRGRALTNGIYKDQKCPCSLVTEEYNRYYHGNRILIMNDGSVNIWCPCMSLELANVFEDKIVTHELLVEREIKLREYLKENGLFKDNMLFMCNIVCDNYVVKKSGIYLNGELKRKF